jgi:hypothetical protein
VLTVQPIQRICKYPLFFRDLCKQTPACDDPVAHTDLKKVLGRLDDTAEQINQAMCNEEVRKRVDISWLLRSRLEFEKVIEHCEKHYLTFKGFDSVGLFKKLGHIILAGVLYVAYPAVNGTKGQYLICLLYQSVLILATLGKPASYRVFLCVPLLNACVEGADNGKGMNTCRYRIPLTSRVAMSYCSIHLEADF